MPHELTAAQPTTTSNASPTEAEVRAATHYIDFGPGCVCRWCQRLSAFQSAIEAAAAQPVTEDTEGAGHAARQASADAEHWRRAVQDMSARWSVDVLADAIRAAGIVERIRGSGDVPGCEDVAADILAALEAPDVA